MKNICDKRNSLNHFQLNKEGVIGIMGAMPEEVTNMLELLENSSVETIGNRTYHTGSINKQKVAIVFSRWGKVAAAATATTLILHFKATKIIFTGVAGAIDNLLNVGDIVIGEKFYQHDMDARPLMQEFEIPLLQKTYFESDAQLKSITYQKLKAAKLQNSFDLKIPDNNADLVNITPQICFGDIASGDHFFADTASKNKLKQKLPSVFCVEMEGAAVAQVCYELQVPFIVIRVISDKADGHSSIDFKRFTENIAGKFSKKIIECIFN